MQAYKRFVYIFILFNIFFILSNFIIWTFYTKQILSSNNKGEHSGDLARMGYIVSVSQSRKKLVNLPRKHIEFNDYKNQRIDVITIGDSFSHGGGGGLNPYYQDYIASINNFNVLNIQPYKEESPFKTISVLLNSGYLDRIKPKYIIIESVERTAIKRFSGKRTFKDKMSMDQVKKFYKKSSDPNYVPRLEFINSGNIKFIFYNILYKFSDHAFISQVYLADLNTPLFTSKNNKKLLFYCDDLALLSKSSDKNINSLNENLNKLTGILKQKGIKLYFMPVVDKYNFYSDYILDNPYLKSTFFEKLRKQKRDYYLIDTKEILQNEFKKGEKDIFHVDDSHWTWKASKKIFETVKF